MLFSFVIFDLFFIFYFSQINDSEMKNKIGAVF
jgi:hypothetical protein